MSKTYLNGKITLTSTAAPNAGDMAKVRRLSDDDRKALVEEVLEVGRNNQISNVTVQEIWDQALAEAEVFQQVSC